MKDMEIPVFIHKHFMGEPHQKIFKQSLQMQRAIGKWPLCTQKNVSISQEAYIPTAFCRVFKKEELSGKQKASHTYIASKCCKQTTLQCEEETKAEEMLRFT